jgi:hypothetical protein
VDEILGGIMQTVFDYCASNLQDDATMLVLRYVPGGSP